jgi:hypothetical protein
LSINEIQLDDVVTLRRDASTLNIHEVRKDVCWDRVMEEEYPYFIALGRLGGTPHCYGCRTPLKDKKKLRVLVKSSYTPPNRIQNLPSLYNICPNSKCIQEAYRKSDPSIGIYLPKFFMKWRVPPPLLESHTSEVSKLMELNQDITFVVDKVE